MLDLDIRHALRTTLRLEVSDPGETLIVDELCVGEREARIDIAVINGRLEGFEIKGPRDSLARLPTQRDAYNAVFDTITVVCARKHLSGVRAVVPRWWGLMTASVQDEQVVLRRTRRARSNPGQDPLAVAQLLWRDEVMVLLEREGGVTGLRSKPKRVLWQVAAERVALDRLSAYVRATLCAREGWRSADPPEPGDGACPPSAMS